MVPPSEKSNFKVKIQEKMNIDVRKFDQEFFFENCNTILV